MCFNKNAENPKEFLAEHFSKSLADENKLLRAEMKKSSENIASRPSSEPAQPTRSIEFVILRREIKEVKDIVKNIQTHISLLGNDEEHLSMTQDNKVSPPSVAQTKKRGRPKKFSDETNTRSFNMLLYRYTILFLLYIQVTLAMLKVS